MFSYDQAEEYFFEEVDLRVEIKEIQKNKEIIPAGEGLARLFSCFKSKPRLDDELDEERDIVFALTKVAYDSRIAQHEIVLKTIYKKLLKTDECRQVGNHWQDIGFQRTDPATDIRGAGMLGALQMLYLVDLMPETL